MGPTSTYLADYLTIYFSSYLSVCNVWTEAISFYKGLACFLLFSFTEAKVSPSQTRFFVLKWFWQYFCYVDEKCIEVFCFEGFYVIISSSSTILIQWSQHVYEREECLTSFQNILLSVPLGILRRGPGVMIPGSTLLVDRSGPARKKKIEKKIFLILSRRKKQEGKESTLLN